MCVLSQAANIRFAEKRDLTQLVQLCQEHADYERADYDPSDKADMLGVFLFGESPVAHCLVVEKDEMLIGFATCMKQFSTWDAGYYIYLDCLYLKADVRGQGLGTLLIHHIIAHARNEKCKVIQWQTPVFNEKAIRFYQKIGGVSKTKERFFLQA